MMKKDVLFLIIIGCCALIFAVYNLVGVLGNRHKTAETNGVIVSVFMPNQVSNFRNSKWAEVRYTVDGRVYTSENRVQVPLARQVGDTVRVRYDSENPGRLYSFSRIRVLAALAVAAASFIAAVLLHYGVL